MIPGNANPLLLASAAAAAAGDSNRSLRFNSADSAYLSRADSSSNQKTVTISFWIKKLGTQFEWPVIFSSSADGNNQFTLRWNQDRLQLYVLSGGNYGIQLTPSRKFRDYSGWLHVLVAVDTTASTASDRAKFYFNGVEHTSGFDFTNTYPSQNENLKINVSGQTINIGRRNYDSSQYIDAYLADFYFIDGSALDPTSFGAFDSSGVWQAAAYSGTFGTNGFHLAFDDSSSNAALGTDSSGNSNSFTVNNLIAAQFSPSATVVGDPTSSTDSPFGVGNGHSVDFDGNDSIRFSGPGLITGDLTVECFLKINSGQSGYQRAFSTNEVVYSSEQTIIRRKNSGSFQFYFGDGTAEETDDTVDANTWHHAAISYDQSASAVSYYVDGTRVGTDTYSGTVKITEMVAAGGMTNENFNGKVSNCRLTKQVLYSGTSYTVPTSTLTTTSQGATASNVLLLCCHKSSTTEVEGVFSAASDTDCLFDVPTNGTQSDTGAGGEVSGNYACFNSLDTPWTLSNGNLDATAPGSPNRSYCPATIFVNSGKYYAEFTLTNNSTSTSPQVGVVKQGDAQGYIGNTGTGGVGYEPATDRVINAGTSTVPFYNTAYTSAGVVVGLGLDMDAGTLVGYVNGTSIGTLATGLSGYYAFACGDINGAGVPEVVVNFGQRAFTYGNAGTNRPAATYKALCTTNLPTPTIADGSTAFDATLWTGNGTSQTITGLEFSPDLVWGKARSRTNTHWLMDTVRGAGQRLVSAETSAEDTKTDILSAFTSDGFTIGGNGESNFSNATYVGWAWDAGSSTVSNTDGSITTSLRVNQTAGFSIATYSYNNSLGSQTLGHGLGVIPDLVIRKDRNLGEDWSVYSKAIGFTQRGHLNTTATWSGTSTFGSASATSTVNRANNMNNGNYVDYSFAAVAGYSAFGSYTGDAGSSNFVHLGFKPRLLIIKRSSDGSNGWHMADTARSPENVANEYLYADTSGAEETNGSIDILSNGFCLKANAQTTNNSGVTYIYMAWASNPFQANGGLAR